MVNALLFTAGVAGLAAAAPTTTLPSHRKTGGFSVPQVRRDNFVAHGPSMYAKALLKFGKTPSEKLLATIKSFKHDRRALLNRRANATSGSASTSPEQYDIEYLTNVSIGTPPQVLSLDFDSGSSDLWVFSSETPSSDINGQSVYSPNNSSTARKMRGSTWTISYGDGSSSSGNVYTDKVVVGGVTVTSQAVECAQTVSSEFTSDTNSDGLLGLAFSSINQVSPTAQKTFFDNIKDSLDEPLWTADLKHDAAGTYNLGYIDSSAYTGSISYTNIDTSEGYWMFTVSSYSIGNSTTTSSSSSSSTTSASTTTSLAATAAATSEASSSSGFPGGLSDGGFGEALEELLNNLFGRQFGGDGGGGSSGSGSGFGSGSGSGAGSSSSSSSSSTDMTAIADTGTTLALLPESVVEEYYAQVAGSEYDESSGGYVFSCDATLSDFSYKVGDTTITIPADYINYSPVDIAGTSCYGALQPNTDVGFTILGDVALKAAFVVFKNEGTTPTIGFASKDL